MPPSLVSDADAEILRQMVTWWKQRRGPDAPPSFVPKNLGTPLYFAWIPINNSVGIPGLIDGAGTGVAGDEPGVLRLSTSKKVRIYVISDEGGDDPPPEVLKVDDSEIVIFNLSRLPVAGFIPVYKAGTEWIAGAVDEIIDAKTNEEIAAGSSGEVILWPDGTESGITVTAHYDWIVPRVSIAADERVRVRHNKHRDRIDIIDHDCP